MRNALSKTVAHLNIIGFRAAVAQARDKSLRGRPFVIAGTNAGMYRGTGRGQILALDCSPEAVRQGIEPGSILAAAQRRVRDLTVLPPDPAAYTLMNTEIEKVAARYAPAWENDRAGNLYLDITGTTGLFGPPADCASRVVRDIVEQADVRPAAAVACNKLVAKVATRAIRPAGLIQVYTGTEADFLRYQDIRILPGMGARLLKTAAVTGIKEIGELAALSVSQALALFGKQGPLLRDMALGVDHSSIDGQGGARRISQQVDFEADTIDETVIRGAIDALAGHGGLRMRNEKSGIRHVRIAVVYNDGVRVEGLVTSKRLLITDREITAAAYDAYTMTANRRIRIRSIGLSLEDFAPLGFQPDLFEPETDTKNRSLQEAVDTIQNRFGWGKVIRGIVLAAGQTGGGLPAVEGSGAD